MNTFFARALAGALILATAPALGHAQPAYSVRFTGADAPAFALSKARAVVRDNGGAALFEADEAFIKQLAPGGNERVVVWDPSKGRVRITPEGATAYWLACADLKPMVKACGAPPADSAPSETEVLVADIMSSQDSKSKGETRGFSLPAARAERAERAARAASAERATAKAASGSERAAAKAAAARRILGGSWNMGDSPVTQALPRCPGDPRCPKLGTASTPE